MQSGQKVKKEKKVKKQTPVGDNFTYTETRLFQIFIEIGKRVSEL